MWFVNQYSPPFFPQQYYSRLALNFQACAHLRVTSANGLTPVMDRAGGRDRKPVTTPSRPLITPQTQVTSVPHWRVTDWIDFVILWTHGTRIEGITCQMALKSLKRHSSLSSLISTFKSYWLWMFSLVLRLLHESEFHTEWGPTPESPAPPFVPLLPDSVSDNTTLPATFVLSSSLMSV